jgi:hypothetical protein
MWLASLIGLIGLICFIGCRSYYCIDAELILPIEPMDLLKEGESIIV